MYNVSDKSKAEIYINNHVPDAKYLETKEALGNSKSILGAYQN